MLSRFSVHPFLILLVGLGVLAGCSGSSATRSDGGTGAPGGPPRASQSDDDGPKPFGEVITDDATSDPGLFTTHEVDGTLYFEIPDSLLGREILTVSRISKTPDGLAYGGTKVNTQTLRWERRNDQIMLRVVGYENVADEEDPVYQAVQNSNFEPIVKTFDVAALNEDSTGTVIDVTDLYTGDVRAMSLPQGARESFRVRRLDDDRTFITDVVSFPENTDVSVVLTYNALRPPSNSSTGTLSLEMNHSMVLLPDEPMQPRHCDDRVGYFNIERVNFSSDEQKAAEECFITRWRLEPSDPEAFARGELVEPVEPIVYYIDPATPQKWRPYLKQGVEDWQVAFERAGFKNAILAKDPPTAEEDSTFDPNDVRYSTIRYFASDIQNAYGPHVHDPRSGEILESDIGWYHNIQNLLRNWYFVQTAAVNPDARGRNFDTDVMGELIRFVAAHEVGHTLGLPHNWGSSHAVPVDSLRSPTYTANHGTAPSIMDYARFNYVAQPGDGVEHFGPRVGEYDKWSIEFGYRPMPEHEGDPEGEALALDDMIEDKADDPVYFYGRSSGLQVDPRSQREDLTDDAVEASRLGVANLKRILPNLVRWTEGAGEDYATLDELYAAIARQWGRYMGHVGRYIGGIEETPKTYDQDGPVYEPLSAEEQRRAMAFLTEEAFQTPTWMMEEEVLRRIEPAGTMDRIRRAQVNALNLVLSFQRLARVMELSAMEEDPYSLDALMTDVREAVWTELRTGEDVDPFRRNLQRGYLERMDMLLNTESASLPPSIQQYLPGYTPINASQSDIRAYVRSELQTLRQQVERRRSSDEATRIHYDDVVMRIDTILDPATDS